MGCWRGTGLIAASLLGCSLGCQMQPPRPAVLDPDFPALLSEAGGPPAPLTRAQKPDPDLSTKGMLELGPNDPGSRDTRGARIRAVVNGEAILDEEVVAAAFQAMVGARTEAEKNIILNKKMWGIIDREVILQDAVAKLSKNGARFLAELKKIAREEFNRQWLHKMMKANNIADEKKFEEFLRNAGMPLDMIRRSWERDFMAQEYLRSRTEPQLNRVGHLQIREFYEKHADDLRVEDSLTWQDLLISVSAGHHASPQAARQFAEVLLGRVKKGEDFAGLAKQYDNGDSSLRPNAEGIGHKRGEIRPQSIEDALFSMKEGETALLEVEVGFRIVRVTKRQYAGTKPFDEKTQKEIRERLRNEIFQQEMQSIVKQLKRKAVIIIANEIK
jgi:hypothetical protein